MDKEYWKKNYQDTWDVSSKREKLVRTLLEEKGIQVEPIGFEAESTEYNEDSPEEKGKPDYKLSGKKEVFLEVTGTNFKSVKKESPIWIRPDKLQWALDHPEQEVWFAHSLDHLSLVRFGRMKDIEHFETVTPRIRGNKETYINIPVDKIELFELNGFVEQI